jgi:hypothetical protein
MGTNTKILTITTLSGVGNTYSASAAGGTIAIEYLADALPAGTVIDAYVLSDTSTATTLIGAGNNYVMSLVLAWVATDSTVPTTAAGKAISMTITNSSIKRGSKIYSVIGKTSTLLGTAAADGSAVISITDDPQIIIAITKPDAPTGVSATSGGNASTTVSWTAPSDGGSAITSYTATSNAGQTCTSTTTSCSVSGLADATSYTFTVTATNLIGTSDSSSASSVIVTQDSALLIAAQQAAASLPGLMSTFSSISTLDSRFTVQITNFDAAFTYSVTSSRGNTSINSTGLITVTNLGVDQSATVTVTTSRTGFQSGTSTVTGLSQVAPMHPSDKPVVTLSDSSIMCTMGKYSATPTSSVFSLFVDGKHVSTIFSALGDYLPDWIIPWATSSTITRTASLTSATWAISDAYKGKSVTCTTLAYSKNAIGLTSSEKATIK